MRILIALLVLFVASLVACGPDYLFEEEKPIPNQQWAYVDTLDFTFNVEDTTALYNLYVHFGYADTFPNQNVYVKFYTCFPDGKRLSKPLSFDLFDPMGNPTGKCSGGKCSARIGIQENAFFNQVGAYTVTLEQYGRRDPLPGLRALGFSVERTEKKK